VYASGCSRNWTRAGPPRQPSPMFTDAAASPRLLALSRAVRLPPGAVLFRPGEACPGLLLIEQGSVRVDLVAEDGHELLLYRIGPGETCAVSLACLFGDEAASAEARAETEVTGRLLPPAAFRQLASESPPFCAHVLRGFGARLAALMARIEELSFRPVDQRLAAFLLTRAPGPVGATQEAIAREIGTAREVVSRRLAALARQGAIAVARGEVAILSEPLLRAIKEGEGAA
jgi:CRP/FNR family transcriptional regulator, anaerobic regulatory protein